MAPLGLPPWTLLGRVMIHSSPQSELAGSTGGAKTHLKTQVPSWSLRLLSSKETPQVSSRQDLNLACLCPRPGLAPARACPFFSPICNLSSPGIRVTLENGDQRREGTLEEGVVRSKCHSRWPASPPLPAMPEAEHKVGQQMPVPPSLEKEGQDGAEGLWGFKPYLTRTFSPPPYPANPTVNPTLPRGHSLRSPGSASLQRLGLGGTGLPELPSLPPTSARLS